jgi:glycosyltransferase involved in cell wall biosynthesis
MLLCQSSLAARTSEAIPNSGSLSHQWRECQTFSAIKDGSETALKQSLGLTGYPIYLTVGGIEPRKNSHKLLQAFAEVLTLYPHAQLAIAGGATLFDYQSYREGF